MASSAAPEADRERSILAELLRPLTSAPEAEAKALLARHGSIAAVFAFASRQQDGPIPRYLTAVHATMAEIARGRLSTAPVIPGSATAVGYLMLEMADLPVEHVRVLFLNVRGRLIADETLMRGTIDSAPLFPREIMRRALELGAASLIVAHNHPSGDPTPSRGDVEATRRLAEAGSALGIALLDHLVLASSGWISMRSEGLL